LIASIVLVPNALALSLLFGTAPPATGEVPAGDVPIAPIDVGAEAGTEGGPDAGAADSGESAEAATDEATPGPSPESEAAGIEAEVDASAETGPMTEASDAAGDGDGGDGDGFSEADIFGDMSDLDIEDGDAESESDGSTQSSGGRGTWASRLPGTLDFEFGLLTSVYVDVDDFPVAGASPTGKPDGYTLGQRWDPNWPGRGTIGRNENRLEFYLNYQPNAHIQLVGGIEPVFMGASRSSNLGDLSSRQMLKPFHVESDKAYVGFLDVAPGLDIKMGRQIVVWGTADKFNPTNNINPDDLEDRPLFTEPIANQMLVVDYSAFEDKLQLQGVWVPIFYPALLPPSAGAALSDPRSPVPFANQESLDDLSFLQDYIGANVRFEPSVFSTVNMPQPHVRNSQAAFKIGSSLGEWDLSASYYYGFHDIPLPYDSQSRSVVPEGEFVDQQPEQPRCCFETEAFLLYPRMHVAGFDFATQLKFLGDMGIWGEGALFVPGEEYSMRIQMPLSLNLPNGGFTNELEGVTIRRVPYLKATAGADYSIGKHVLLLAQYMRGFIDEFGADHIGNYIMGGTQLQFLGRQIIAQVFAVGDVPTGAGDPGSFVIAPEFAYTPPWGYVTMKLGAFALVGKRETKFGQLATGSSIAYARFQARF
jgi:hypothetical protein